MACKSCPVRHLCLAGGVSADEVAQVELAISGQRRVKRGETLFRTGDAFASVYAVRYGCFKTSGLHGDGRREQVTRFALPGDLLGMDGMGEGRHVATAVALEDSLVCIMVHHRAPQHHVASALARELARARAMMLLLGSMRAEERLAAFLSALSASLAHRGQSAGEFHLRMTRQDIASYLGISLETVSRMFSQFQKRGLISVKRKHVRIVEADRLGKLARCL